MKPEARVPLQLHSKQAGMGNNKQQGGGKMLTGFQALGLFVHLF